MGKLIERHATLYARNETEFWDAEVLSKYNIVAAFCIYCVPDDDGSTVDVSAIAYENVFHHAPGTSEDDMEKARDELSFEGLSDRDYLMRDSIASADPRFVCRVSAEVDESEWTTGDEVDTWREQCRMGLGEWPAILDAAPFIAWQAEKQAARRALNIPPIANYGANGLDNLPLFVAAANRLLEPHKPALDRLDRMKGGCAASRAAKNLIYKAGLSWPLPPAESFIAAR